MLLLNDQGLDLLYVYKIYTTKYVLTQYLVYEVDRQHGHALSESHAWMMKKSIEVEDGIHMEISWSEADAAKQALAGKQASD